MKDTPIMIRSDAGFHCGRIDSWAIISSSIIPQPLEILLRTEHPTLEVGYVKHTMFQCSQRTGVIEHFNLDNASMGSRDIACNPIKRHSGRQRLE